MNARGKATKLQYAFFFRVEVTNKELERLEKDRVIERVDYSDWASLTVYIKNKNKKMSVLIFQWT